MATLDFYIDIDRQLRVRSGSDSSVVSIPQFSLGDTNNFRIHLLQPTGNTVGTPYTPILTAGKTLQFAIGTLGGSTRYVEQYTWVGNDSNAQDPYFTADVSFNTTQMVTLLTNVTSATGYLQIILNDGNPKTAMLKQVTLRSGVILNSTLTTNPGQSYATMDVVNALLANIRTQTVTIVSADGSHQERLWLGNDATPHNDVS